MSNTYKLFTAEWCGNCKTVKTALAAMDIQVELVDIDQDMIQAQANNIRSLPTMITESGERVLGSAKIIEFLNKIGG